jgi:integrase
MLKTPPIKVPSYRLHKATGQAFVQVKGRRIYLGRYGTEPSQERYRRFVAELVASPAAELSRSTAGLDVRPGASPEIAEIALAYWRFAKGYYVKDGSPTGQIPIVRQAIRILREMYAHSPAVEFGPLSLRRIQEKLAADGKARKTVNHVTTTIKHVFKWSASQELIPVTIYQALATVPGVKRGRTAARETSPIGPVAPTVVDQTLPNLPPIVADMVRFQRLTGCRPSEVCLVRPGDVDRSGDVWIYRPHSHKTDHHDRERIIVIGPKAQDVLRPYLLRPADTYCFSPAERVAKLRAEQRTHRKSKVQPSQVNRRKHAPKRAPGAHYTRDSYRCAIERACDRAFPPSEKLETKALELWRSKHRWSPNQLRHSCATEIRRSFGLEAAQVILGHSKADVTQVYAERDLRLAAEVMRKIG